MPAVTTTAPTGDVYVDSLLGDLKWAVNNLTYSFPTDGSLYGTPYGSNEPITEFGTLNLIQQATVHTALSMYAAVANLTFAEIAETSTTHADLRFAQSDVPSTAWAYFPSTAAEGGDSWFNKTSGWYSAPSKGNYAYLTFLHEIGHALGLEHPHESGMPLDRDSLEYTVMSYRSYTGASTTGGYVNESWGYAQSLMMYDIAALQALYGANYATNSGDTRYAWSPTTGEMVVNGIGQGAPGDNRILLTVWDGGGLDTYDFSAYATGLTVDLQPGAWSTTSSAQLARLHWNGSKLAAGTIANALLHQGDTRALIENASGGSGSDSIVGNQAANSLAGNAGDDRLTGGLGDDVLNGGAGTDTAVFRSQRSNYSVTLLADGSLQILDLRAGGSEGRDIVWATELFQFSDRLYSLADLTSTDEPVTPDEPTADEGLVLTGTEAAESLYGAGGNDLINGQAGNDYLYGLDGDDILTGGAGRDRLDGGAGTDTASYASAASAVLADLASPSRNTRDAYRDTYVGIENLTGSAYSDSLRGNDSANDILGGAGSDTLYGRGGGDLLEGGDGNDSLDGASASDSLDGGAGRDTLYGGTGADSLDGGAGVDIFVFKSGTESAPGAQDIIANFVSGTDKIDLRSIDANTKLSRNQAFSFIGGDDFNGQAGELRFSGGILSGDVNGDGTADFKISLPDTSLLRATDFYL